MATIIVSPSLARTVQVSEIANGDFEEWATDTDASSWVESPGISNITRETVTVYNGSSSVKITRLAGESSNLPSLVQTVTVEVDKSYTFSVRVQDNDPNAWIRLVMTHGSETGYSDNSTDGTDWQELKVTEKMTNTACTISIIVYSTNNGTVYVDLAQFSEVEEIPVIAGIPVEMIWILGIGTTVALVAFCLYLGYRKKTHEPLKSTRVLTQVAVFSALGFVLSFFSIPMPLDTHLSFHLYPAFLISMAYGPFVGLIVGAITGSKGMMTGNWTGPVSNAIFCIIVGTLAMYMNPKKRGRPLYMIMFNVIVVTWTFGLLHMAYTFSGLVVPLLVVLNVLLSMPNNIIYGILVESTIHIDQIWDPLTEESTLHWFSDEYQEPDFETQKRHTTIQLLVFNALLYGWFAVIWLSPPFKYFGGTEFNIYNPLLFSLMMLFVVMLLIACYLVYRAEKTSLASILTLAGSILTLPVGLMSLYVWFKYLRKSEPEAAS